MGRSIFQQETQIRSTPDAEYDDTVAPSLANYQTTPVNLQEDLNNIRSMLSYLKDIQAGNWYDTQTAPSTLEAGVLRGVDDLNDALHVVEKKRVMRCVEFLVDITVSASQNWEVLGTGELPSNTTAAVGAVTTIGTIVAPHGGTFDTHSLAEVAGTTAVNPKNLVPIVDGATRDPIVDSNGRRIWGLLQVESGVTDGVTITDTTTTRAQISFVTINATADDLIAAPIADIENQVINVCWPERVRLEDLTEQDFLSGGNIVDVPSGTTVTRQVAYDNQGTTPVDQTTNATLDLEAAGIFWEIRDDLEARLFAVIEGSAGGTSEVQIAADVDVFNVDAVTNDFLNGASFDTGAAGTTIDIGVTAANTITSGGALDITSTAADLRLVSGNLLAFSDTNQAGSGFGTDFVLSDSSAEWDAFETEFGEVSLLNALVQALTTSDVTKTCAVVNSTTVADTDIGGSGGGANLDAQIHDLSTGDFLRDHDVYWNGQLLRGDTDTGGANNHDYYPGTSLALGQIRLEFIAKVGDQLCVISRA